MDLNPLGWFRSFRPIPQDVPRKIRTFDEGRVRGTVTMTCEEAEDLKAKIEQIMLDAELNEQEREMLRTCDRVLARGGS